MGLQGVGLREPWDDDVLLAMLDVLLAMLETNQRWIGSGESE